MALDYYELVCPNVLAESGALHVHDNALENPFLLKLHAIGLLYRVSLKACSYLQLLLFGKASYLPLKTSSIDGLILYLHLFNVFHKLGRYSGAECRESA